MSGLVGRKECIDLKLVLTVILIIFSGLAGSDVRSAADTDSDDMADGAIMVSNVWVDVPLTQVLRDISMETGVIIATGPGIPDPLISFDASSSREIERCLREVITGQGLYISRRGSRFYLITSGDPTSPGFIEVAEPQRFYLKYVTAQHLKSSIPRSLQQYVTSGERDNEILVYAIPQITQRITEIIDRLDVPRQQVVLEVLVVDLWEKDSERFGLDWQYSDSHVTVSMEKGMEAFTGIASYASVPQSNLTRVLLTLQTLIGQEKAQIRSRPRVATLNGQKAIIDITREEYYTIATDVYATSLRTELEVIKSGVLLEITPHIGDNGDITVDVLTEVSDVVSRQNKIEGSDSGDLPIIRRRKADTCVRVKDGDAIVIGGLVETQERQKEKKIAGLSSLPIIGGLFKATDDSSLRKEVMIFITPRLIKEDENFSALADMPLSVDREISSLREVVNLLGAEQVPQQRDGSFGAGKSQRPFADRHEMLNVEDEINSISMISDEQLRRRRKLSDVDDEIDQLREVASVLAAADNKRD